ncbi:MAG TPA: hypothetical protein VJ738_01940 [Steroidobacteraceae bacterium]|nr:hypothetical protein [Steroidobacteraceae bacterium]
MPAQKSTRAALAQPAVPDLEHLHLAIRSESSSLLLLQTLADQLMNTLSVGERITKDDAEAIAALGVELRRLRERVIALVETADRASSNYAPVPDAAERARLRLVAAGCGPY